MVSLWLALLVAGVVSLAGRAKSTKALAVTFFLAGALLAAQPGVFHDLIGPLSELRISL